MKKLGTSISIRQSRIKEYFFLDSSQQSLTHLFLTLITNKNKGLYQYIISIIKEKLWLKEKTGVSSFSVCIIHISIISIISPSIW